MPGPRQPPLGLSLNMTADGARQTCRNGLMSARADVSTLLTKVVRGLVRTPNHLRYWLPELTAGMPELISWLARVEASLRLVSCETEHDGLKLQSLGQLT